MITNARRRARLATRHALTPSTRLSTVEDVADRLLALHATEAASVHLAVAARTETSGIVRQALADVGAVLVDLEGDLVGYVLPDDIADADPGGHEDWAALLPTLDSTSMGWKQRDWYLAPEDVPYLVDANGNIGTTAWWNGRVVGAWVQDPDGVVSVVTRAGPESAALERLDIEAERLSRFLDGVVIPSVYTSQLMRGARLS